MPRKWKKLLDVVVIGKLLSRIEYNNICRPSLLDRELIIVHLIIQLQLLLSVAILLNFYTRIDGRISWTPGIIRLKHACSCSTKKAPISRSICREGTIGLLEGNFLAAIDFVIFSRKSWPGEKRKENDWNWISKIICYLEYKFLLKSCSTRRISYARCNYLI